MPIRSAWGIAPVVIVSACAHADLITYQYDGTVATNTPWASLHGKPVKVRLTIDLDTPASQATADRKQYDGAVTAGYFQVDGIRFPIDPNGSRNITVVRTGVFDINSGLTFNQYNINVSTDGVDRDPFVFPSNILFNLYDYDAPADTVRDLELDQPLDTLKTISHGGVDKFAVGLGVAIGSTHSTVTSGDGGMSIVPTPGTGALLALGGCVAVTRRR